jgi:hypothetical protein
MTLVVKAKSFREDPKKYDYNYLLPGIRQSSLDSVEICPLPITLTIKIAYFSYYSFQDIYRLDWIVSIVKTMLSTRY